MRRFSMNRWMALVLSLAFACATLAATSHTASALPIVGGDGGDDGLGSGGGTGYGGGTPMPGPGDVGDPDSPQNGYKQVVIKGTALRTSASRTAMTEGDGRLVQMDWMWRLQVVFKTALRLRYLR